MADKTGIEWTDATWNPIRGCTRVSEGCRNCYAEKVAARFSGPGQPYAGLAQLTQSGPRWTGEVRFISEHLTDPLRWQRPRKIFVNSMSDLFHEALSDERIARVFAVMGLAFQHTFQVLTKRAERLPLIGTERFQGLVREATREHPRWLIPAEKGTGHRFSWPLPNVWIGVSVEDQKTADQRIPHLLKVPARVRFLSMEPLLGPVDLKRWLWNYVPTSEMPGWALNDGFLDGYELAGNLQWVIAGGESGPGARPSHPNWFRSLRDQCQAASVPFFFKQWGAWGEAPGHEGSCSLGGGRSVQVEDMARIGKKAAGRVLDGRTWDEMPGGAP